MTPDPQDTPVLKAILTKIIRNTAEIQNENGDLSLEASHEYAIDEAIEAISELIATKEREARIDELEKMKSDAKKYGWYTESTANGLADEIDERIAELRNTKVEK